MRQWVILVAVSVVLGVGIALLVHFLGGQKRHETESCTAQSLAPGLTWSNKGDTASIGFEAAGPGGVLTPCFVPTPAPRVISIRITGADGQLVFSDLKRTGPPPGFLVTQPFRYRTSAPALRLCNAAQPVTVEVAALGIAFDGKLSLKQEDNTCRVG